MSESSEISREMAARLNETQREPRKIIERLVKVKGEAWTLALLEETLALETGDGILTDDGQRRRSPGGAFFKLAKDRLTVKERGRVFGPPPKRKGGSKSGAVPAWDDLRPALAELLVAHLQGEAILMKMTLIGVPGKIINKGDLVLTRMTPGKAPGLPKGVPTPPADPGPVLLFIAAKQWRKVQPALAADPADRLVVEGYPVLDKRIGGGALCLYAQSVTTLGLQRSRRETRLP